MGGLPDPDWYLDNVLVHTRPGDGSPVAPGPIAKWAAWWKQLAVGGDPLAQLAASQGFVVTSRQVREAGWRDHDLRREVRRRTWSVPTRGTAAPVVIAGDKPADQRRRHVLASTAAALLRPGQVISGRSGAILHGLPTMSIPDRAQLTAAGARLGRCGTSLVRGAALSASEATRWSGAPVTTIARTLVDLARHDRRDAIMAADAALAEAATQRRAIEEALATAVGWPGIRQARAVLALADPLAESPLESLTRLALHDSGFPPPLLQVEISDPRRRAPWRVDALWPPARLVLECDGLDKYTDSEVKRERYREGRLRALGYRVERVLWADVVSYWPETSARLWQALRNSPSRAASLF